jgi:hypothetical protein
MKRSCTSALVALATAALFAAAIPAHAANPTRVAAKAGAQAKHSTRPATRSDSKKSAKPVAAAAVTTTSDAPTTPSSSVICFQNSVRCFAAVRPPGIKVAALDLRAPDVRKVFPIGELQKRLPDADDQLMAQEDTTVQVSTDRELPPPTAPVGILAPFWAIRHPTQAWRIFMPVPEAK